MEIQNIENRLDFDAEANRLIKANAKVEVTYNGFKTSVWVNYNPKEGIFSSHVNMDEVSNEFKELTLDEILAILCEAAKWLTVKTGVTFCQGDQLDRVDRYHRLRVHHVMMSDLCK